jgi:hypothetical protein
VCNGQKTIYNCQGLGSYNVPTGSGSSTKCCRGSSFTDCVAANSTTTQCTANLGTRIFKERICYETWNISINKSSTEYGDPDVTTVYDIEGNPFSIYSSSSFLNSQYVRYKVSPKGTNPVQIEYFDKNAVTSAVESRFNALRISLTVL